MRDLRLCFTGGRLCTFSPCIEQVQKTCEALKKSNSFVMIRTQEVLQQSMSIHTKTLMSIDFNPPEDAQGAKGPMGPVKKAPCKFRTLVPPVQIPGHTGYVTFATYVPPESEVMSSEEEMR